MNAYTMGKIAAEVYIIIMLCIIFAQWKKSDKELKAFGISALYIALGNLAEVFSCLLTGNASAIFLMLAIICGNASLPFFAFFYVHKVNADARRTVLKAKLPRAILFLSTVNIVLTIILFILFFVQPNGSAISAAHIKTLLYSSEGLSALILCITVATKRRYMQPGTFFILTFPILLCIAAFISTFIFPQHDIINICISIGIFLQYITLLRRIGSEAELKEQITMEILRTDALTHLMNRQAYSDFLDMHTDVSDAGVLFFDVNGLKKINDIYGHSEGDKLIVKCAELLDQNLLNADLYRISGDEFVAIYYGAEKREYCKKEIEELKSVLKKNGSLMAAGDFWGKQMLLVDTIKHAEERMYVDKRAFYEASGKERRHS